MTGPDLSERLTEIADQPNGGAAAAATLGHWLSADQPFVNGAELRRFAERAPLGLIVDSFRCDIPFGTGGRRGRVGIGPNRINPRTLALTVAGHCEFLRQTGGDCQRRPDRRRRERHPGLHRHQPAAHVHGR